MTTNIPSEPEVEDAEDDVSTQMERGIGKDVDQTSPREYLKEQSNVVNSFVFITLVGKEIYLFSDKGVWTVTFIVNAGLFAVITWEGGIGAELVADVGNPKAQKGKICYSVKYEPKVLLRTE